MNVQTDARVLDLKSAQKVIRKCTMNSSNSNNDNKSGDEIGIDLLDIPFIVIMQSDYLHNLSIVLVQTCAKLRTDNR